MVYFYTNIDVQHVENVQGNNKEENMIERKRINKKATYILTSDWHLRDDQPMCRTDNYFKAQEKKLKFIQKLSKENNNCSVLCAGDLFHRARSSPYLEAYTIRTLPKNFISIPGQHDLLNHNISKFYNSSIGVLWASGILATGNLNIIENKIENIYTYETIGIVHKFIQKPNDQQDKIIGGSSALYFLKKHKKYNLILTGDNHKTFIIEHEGRLLINPGSLMRMTAAQINHKPCVFLYYKDNNTVKQIFLPIEKNIIDREHIVKEERKEKRFEAFIKQLESYPNFQFTKNNKNNEFSFANNLNNYFIRNKTSETIKNIIWEVVE